jgi:twitching motility protein PilT
MDSQKTHNSANSQMSWTSADGGSYPKPPQAASGLQRPPQAVAGTERSAQSMTGGQPPTQSRPVAQKQPVQQKTQLDFELKDLLQVMTEYKASDLHIKAGSPPTVRIDGELMNIGDHKLTPGDCKTLIFSCCTRRQQDLLESGDTLDYAYSGSGVRFRVNAYHQRGTMSACIRLVRGDIPGLDELYLPPAITEMLDYRNGIALVTGPAGSGKSTTLAALIDYINVNKPVHIVTIEDPIEYYHNHKKGIITQREVGSDTLSFEAALKYSLRQDPNVILIGEMRDPDTIMTAARASETGHFVLSTLHTPNCTQAITRILDIFTGENRKQMRLLLASNLRGVVSQRLIPRIDSAGRVPAVELMLVTSTISSLILDDNISEIYTFISQGATEGMQTMNQSMYRLYKQGYISREQAIELSDQPTEMRMMLEGHTTGFGTMMDHEEDTDSGDMMSWV